MISPGTDASGSSLPSTAHFDLARLRHRRLDDDLAIELRGELMAAAQLGDVLRLRDADARSEVRRLHEHGKAQALTTRLQIAALVALPVALQHDLVVADRQALRARTRASSPPCPCRPPTRARRRRRTARSPARAALHRAVFTVRTVQHREHDVEREPATAFSRPAIDRHQRVAARVRVSALPRRRSTARSPTARESRRRRDERRRRRGQRPAAVLLDADRHRVVASRIEILKTAAAEASDTSCSPDGRRRCTPTRSFFTGSHAISELANHRVRAFAFA
jgi:hypothetical protein